MKQISLDINSKLKSILFIITLTTLTMLLYSFSASTIYAEHDAASQSGNNMGNSMGNSMGNMGDMGSMLWKACSWVSHIGSKITV